VEKGRIPEAAGRWKALYGIRRPVRVVTSDDGLSPFTMGVRRPVIYLPAAAAESGNGTLLESILGHELAHVKRFDDLWVRIGNLAAILHFFNPAAWIALSRVHLFRECLCDEMAVSKQLLSPESYGAGLLSVLKWNLFGTESMEPLAGFGNSRRKIMKRIESIKVSRRMGKARVLAVSAFTVALGCFLLPMAGRRPSAAAASVPSDLKPVAEKSGFRPPLEQARISAAFGPMRDPFTGKKVDHTGVDIRAPKGTPVLAVADGKVVAAMTAYTVDQGRGRHVIILHKGGTSSVYTHLDSLWVHEGQEVRAGEPVGTVGMTGRSTGPHLHLEIRDGETPIDPASVIDFGKGKLKEVKEKTK
jgi:hypothetical protein